VKYSEECGEFNVPAAVSSFNMRKVSMVVRCECSAGDCTGDGVR